MTQKTFTKSNKKFKTITDNNNSPKFKLKKYSFNWQKTKHEVNNRYLKKVIDEELFKFSKL